MAFIRTSVFKARYVVEGIDLPYIPDITPDWIPESGKLLPDGKGFPSRIEVPRPSFKIYKAMCRSGYKSYGDYVLEHRRRSLITPNYIWQSVGNFAKKTTPRCQHPNYKMALDRLRTMMDLDTKLKPLDIETASQQIPQNTSPGLPYILSHPGLKKGDILETELPGIKAFWKGLYGSTRLLPDSAAFARSHISDPATNKVRPVWAVPLVVICQEARFALPITDALIKQQILQNTAYGCEMMKGGMMWINSQVSMTGIRYPGTKYFLTDYTAFDSSVPAWFIRDVFGILMEKFDLTTDDKECFIRCINYFINTPIRNCDGKRFVKSHGIPSGSMFTNIIGTLVNMVASWACCATTFDYLPLWDIYFGDDGLIALPPSAILDITAYSKCAMTFFGMTVSTKKSYWTSNPMNIHFLGYYNFNGTPYKDPVDIFAAMLYPQHLQDDWSYCISRSLGCLLATAGATPDVFQVCKSVYTLATIGGTNIDEAISRIEREPRSLRHLITMGLGGLRLTKDFFFNYKLSLPLPNCNKFLKQVMLLE